jgi:hypothetical protein
VIAPDRRGCNGVGRQHRGAPVDGASLGRPVPTESLVGVADRSPRPHSSPIQVAEAVEVAVA